MNKVLQMLDQATDDDLLMSRFNCHVIGVHSIVLKNDSGRLTRCFLADRNHHLYGNLSFHNMALQVGVHDHRYDLLIKGITGVAINATFGESLEGFECSKYKFTDGQGSEWLGKSNLRLKEINPLYGGFGVFMHRAELHTMFVPKGQRASWLVKEGYQLQDHTLLYTNSSPLAAKHTVFNSADSVREFVKSFYNSESSHVAI
jgi:hypothetical protein